MRKHVLLVATLLAALAGNAAAAIDQTIWLDASDPSTLVLNGGVVESWRDKTPHHNDLNRQAGTPLFTGGGVELVERTSGVNDRLQGTATLAPPGSAFLMFIVAHPYTHLARLFLFAGNNMSVLQRGQAGVDDRFHLQINNNNTCELPLAPAGIGAGKQVYVMQRVPAGTGSFITFERFGGPDVSSSVACGPEDLHTLTFDQGGTNFPTNPLHGLTVFEVLAFTAPAVATSSLGTQGVISPFDDAFIQSTLTQLAVKWNVNQPTPVESTTWGRIKLLGR